MFSGGDFICWLASNLGGRPLVGAHRKPLTEAAARANWLKAIDALRTLPGMSRRYGVQAVGPLACPASILILKCSPTPAPTPHPAHHMVLMTSSSSTGRGPHP